MPITEQEFLWICNTIAKQSMFTVRDIYYSSLQALRDSKGACEKLFRKRIQEINWRDFGNALARRLAW